MSDPETASNAVFPRFSICVVEDTSEGEKGGSIGLGGRVAF